MSKYQVFVEIGDWRPLFPIRVGEEIGDIGAARLNAYVKELEHPLLAATREFYAREASLWIGSDSCPEYLKKVLYFCFCLYFMELGVSYFMLV